MKAIINGVRFDTDKAIEIGDASGGTCPKTHWREGLYQTPRAGRYFIAGSGGGRTHYAVHGVEGWWPGERITPATEAEAFAWAQENLDPEAVEEHFGHMIEDA